MKNRRAVLRKVATASMAYHIHKNIQLNTRSLHSCGRHLKMVTYGIFRLRKGGTENVGGVCLRVCVRHAMNVALFTNAANIMYVPFDGKGWIEKEKESRMVHTLELAQQ